MVGSIARSCTIALVAVLTGVLVGLGIARLGASEASAQGGEIEVSEKQLRINQRISQAAVRRSNAALDRAPEWAVVVADGRLVRATSGVTVERTGVGSYRLGFGRDLSECAFTASQIQPNPRLIGNTGLSVAEGSLRTLEVQTANVNGQASDRNFTVQVTC
jgi:hypothetical protein